MKKRNKKFIPITILVLLIVATLAVINQPGLIYGGTGSTRFDNGMQAWIVTAFLNNLDSSPAKIVFSTSEMQDASDRAGTELKPKDSETIRIELTKKDCVYNVDSLNTIGGNGIYKVFNPQLDFEIKTTAESTGSYSLLSLQDTRQTKIISKQNGGTITASVAGISLQSYCYIPDNARIVKIGSDYTFVDWDQMNALTTKTSLCSLGSLPGLVTCYLTGIIDPDDAKDQNFYRNYRDIRFTSTQLRGEPTKAIGNLQMILTADKEYFDAEPVVTPAASGEPKIVSVLCPDVQSGREASMKVVVKNIGQTGDISVRVDGNLVDIEPLNKQTQVFSGEQKTHYFTIKPTSVTSKKTYNIDVVASSINQIGEGSIDSKTCSGSISPITVVPLKNLEYCGNDDCEPGESIYTCPKDCKSQTCDPNKLEFLNEDSGKCECPVGFARDENDICNERDSDNTLIFILVGLIFAVVVLILIMRTGGKKNNGGLL